MNYSKFPFKKGKINGEDKYIAIEIDSPNTSNNSHWDFKNTNIKPADEYSSGFLRSFNVESHDALSNKSKLFLHIKHDKYNQGVNVGLIGFNDVMTIKNIYTKDDISLDDVFLTLLTPYGKKRYYQSKGLVIFEKRKVGAKEIEITIGLKNLRKDLADPNLRDWYWMPDNYFAQRVWMILRIFHTYDVFVRRILYEIEPFEISHETRFLA